MSEKIAQIDDLIRVVSIYSFRSQSTVEAAYCDHSGPN